MSNGDGKCTSTTSPLLTRPWPQLQNLRDSKTQATEQPAKVSRVHPLKCSNAGFTARRQPVPKGRHYVFINPEASDTESEPGVSTPMDTPRVHPITAGVACHSFSSSEAEAERLSSEPESQAVPERAIEEPAAKPGLPGAFGSLSQKVDGRAREQFDRYAVATDEHKKEGKKAYKAKEMKYTRVDGTTGVDVVWVRSKAKRGEKLQTWLDVNGKRLQSGLNRFRDVLGRKINLPRTTGSRYGSGKGKGLLGQTNQLPNDYTSATLFDLRLANNGVNQGMVNSHPAVAADLAPVTDGLTAFAAVPSGIDAVFAGEAYLRLDSVPEKAKKDLIYVHAARRFVDSPENATPEDAEGYLKFIEAGEKLFETTLEDSATVDAAQCRAVRSGMTAGANAMGAGIAITNVVGSVNPLVAVAALPLTVVGGVVEVKESRQELLRRVDQKARADLRTQLMSEVSSGTDSADPAYALMTGLVDCLNGQQNRLRRQAEREEDIALAHAFKGGGSVGAALGVAGALAAVAVGAITIATAGAALAGPLLVGGIWGGTVTYRNHKRVRADHTAKWRQRQMQAAALVTPREELEKLLITNGTIKFAQEEGEYLPEEGHFAGLRTLELNARDNEYLGLHVLALQVQDLVRGKPYDENSRYMKLLDGLGIDKLRLLAICKAAAGKKPNEQLDYIQAKIAPKLGIKFTVGASQTQAPPHPSNFIDHFRTAWEKAAPTLHLEGTAPLHHKERYSTDLYPAIKKELEALYPDPQAGMQAFRQAIDTFLKKTGEPQVEDIKMLEGFTKYLKAREEFGALVEKKNATDIRKAVVEANDLVDQLQANYWGQLASRTVPIQP